MKLSVIVLLSLALSPVFALAEQRTTEMRTRTPTAHDRSPKIHQRAPQPHRR